MKRYFFKWIPVALLPISNIAIAAGDLDSRVSLLEQEMKEVRVKNAMGTYGATTAGSRVHVENGRGWFLSAGPIYQHARINGTDFAYTDDDLTGGLPIRGNMKENKFEWDWGLRAAIGCNMIHDEWDLRLEYTWLSSNGSRSVSSGFNDSIHPLRIWNRLQNECGLNIDFVAAGFAKSEVDFDYNTLVLELGRNYFVSKMLSLRPHFGLRSAWIDLDQDVRFTGGQIENNSFYVKDSSDMWGLGPRVGLDTNWFIGCGFNIFANGSASLLYSIFDVEHHEKYSSCDFGSIRLDGDDRRVIPAAAMQLGLAYERYIFEQEYHIVIRLGYDATYYWRANQSLKINNQNLNYDRYSEDVAIHGVMLDAKLSF